MHSAPAVPRALWAVVACICAASLAFMWYASSRESATMDELAHIPAGYGYVRHLDFRLNPEHPPLLKALSAAPLLALQPNFPTDIPAWTRDVNGQWDMGSAFLYKSGNDARVIVQVSRIAPMLLTLLLIIIIYAWSQRLMGGGWALLPTILFAFSPIVLAHGHYVTTDLAAALGIVLATWTFVKALQEPSLRNIFVAGLALGVAELMKFSAILLLPFLAGLALVHFLVNVRGLRGTFLWRAAARKLWSMVLVGLVAYIIVVYPVYFLFTLNYPVERQVSDTQAILTSLIGNDVNGGCSGAMSCLAQFDIWMAGNPVLRPFAHYLLGLLMVIQRAAGGNTAYFLGQVSATGSHWYFPLVYILKESLPALGVLLIALLVGLGRAARRVARRESVQASLAWIRGHFAEFAMLAFTLLYWAYSIRSTLNIGVRHLMPIIPFMYMLAAGAWRRWVMGFRIDLASGALSAVWSVARSVFASSLKLSILLALAGWMLVETFVAAPHFLPYFNQIGGGVREGYRFVTDSNYDWGQDLLRLRTFVETHPEIDRIAVDYFGAGSPAYELGDRYIAAHSASQDPRDQGVHWVAISVNFLQNSLQPAVAGFPRGPQPQYPWLTALRAAPPGRGELPEPDHRPGPSIFVYYLP